MKLLNFLKSKISFYKKLFVSYGYYSALIALINNLIYKFLKKKYFLTPLEHHKYYLTNKIIEISKSKVMYGHYKNTRLVTRSHWNYFDFAPKFLGFYEEQIQNLIVDVKKKNNLKTFINIGCGDGYHTLGLIKNNIFNNAICYEISNKAKKNLRENLKINKIEKKILLRNKADIQQIKKDLNIFKIEETLFLIDIEGDEFELFLNTNLSFLRKGFFIIEEHSFEISNKVIIKKFYSILNKYFNVTLIPNGPRNPFVINNNFLDNLNDDSRFLILSEHREKKMHWIFLSPKN